MKQFLVLFLFLMSFSIGAQQASDGQFKSGNESLVWSEAKSGWVSPEQFWSDYAQQRGGITWGTSDTYPPYEQVKEYDTFMVQLGSKVCLMEFFHSRWRRANDVRRWDDKFNEYGACPNVFD